MLDKGVNFMPNPRCLYDSSFQAFLYKDINSIFGTLCDNYHGDALTTTREAWKSEIEIMRSVISKLDSSNGQIIFEYDIPRLGKRIDVVLLYRGIVFLLNLKLANKTFSLVILIRFWIMLLI